MTTMSTLRALSAVRSRADLMDLIGRTFGGKRNVNKALGYKETLTFEDFEQRYDRNGLAARVVDAFPEATWRGIGELIEDDTTVETTEFEEAWFELEHRLHLWAMLKRVDIVAGLGRYAVLLLGAPGALDTELPQGTDKSPLLYVSIYTEKEAAIEEWDLDFASARFGFPVFYRITRKNEEVKDAAMDEKVHWSRVIHVADGLLSNFVFGKPRLQRVWNDLDDLVKVKGGGAEAFWIRAHQGFQIDVGEDVELSEEEEKELDAQADAFEAGFRRTMRTQGVKMKALGSDVADFKNPVAALVSLISASTGIPQRILMGSERGELASTQDDDTFKSRVNDRQQQLAGPFIVQQLADRLIEFNYLPTPEQYQVRWPTDEPTTPQRVDLAAKMATANASNVNTGGAIFSVEEIRDRAMAMEPMDEATKEELDAKAEQTQRKTGEETGQQSGGEVTRAARQRRVQGTALDKRRHWWRNRRNSPKKPHKNISVVKKVEADVA